MEEPGSGKIVHIIASASVNWGAKVLDSFEWILTNVGQTHLTEAEEEQSEGYCRCHVSRGRKCGPECEMRKVCAECAWSAHKELNCGNKRVQNFMRKGSSSPIELTFDQEIGIGVRASRQILRGEIIGIYWGRAMPAGQVRPNRNGHCYVVDFKDGVRLNAAKEGSLMRYVNSSCRPNLRLEEWDVLGQRIILERTSRLRIMTLSGRESAVAGCQSAPVTSGHL
eukprot:3938070-Rhodomonas_salina.1